MKSTACKNHPDRPRFGDMRLCEECTRAYQRARNREYQKKNFTKNEIPSKEELADAVEKKYPIKSIAQRYRVSISTAGTWLRKYGIEIPKIKRHKLTDEEIKIMRDERMNCSIRIMDFEYSAVPKHYF